MNIMIFNAYYTPESAASMNLEEDIAEGYAKEGNTVTMYVPMPSRGVSKGVREDYKKKKIELQHEGRLKIIRYNLMKEGKNPVLRAMRYFLQNVKQYKCGVNTKNIDAIFSGSTPPTQGAMCALVKKKLCNKYKRYVPYVFNLQDIFPDSLVNAGMTHEGSILWKIGRKLEDFTYRNSDAIIVISESFKRNIMNKGVPEEKITVVSNWIDISQVRPVSKEQNKLFEEFGINRFKYTVVYAGNFGGSQGADVVIRAADYLRDEKDIQIVVFGGGTEYDQAKTLARDLNLENIQLFDLLPPSRISEVYSLGDVSLVTCLPGVGEAGMPSKTWSIMACNTPIIASFDTDSELSEILNDNNSGICVEPGNAQKLAEAILNEFHSLQIGHDGRNFVEAYASKQQCVEKYVSCLEKTVRTSAGIA